LRRPSEPAQNRRVKEFKAFLLRGNLVELAVAVVIGVAFAELVQTFVTTLITPLLAAIGGKQDFSQYAFTIRDATFHYGIFLNSLITFATIAAVIFFFVVKPVNALMARRKTEEPVDETTRDCPECLSSVPLAARRCAFCTVELGP
jgi:large conductance mechanosensitive channel